MNSFVKHRPSVPLGTKIGSFPPVTLPLHCDEYCEVYLLEKQSGCVLLAVLQPFDEGESIDEAVRKLENWFSILPTHSVDAELIDSCMLEGRTYVRAIIRVFGNWGPECGTLLSEMEDSALRIMLKRTLALCEKSRKAGLCPVFSISLVWLQLKQGNENLVPIIAKPWSPSHETDAIREITRVVYFLTAGIDPVETSSPDKVVALSRWTKKVGSDTSRVLAKCLQPSRKADAIIDFAAFSSELSNEGTKVHQKKEELTGLARVAGMHKLKSLLQQEVIDVLRNPETFKRYGLTVPNGILLFGPPGCGKTYISQQLAEELGYFFLEVIPSEVAGMYIHQTVLKIRDVFETAAEMAPSVIFIDEFEALVPPRSALGAHQQYKSEEVNELLVQLGTCAEQNIFLIAATNEPSKIDVAVRRTGRLDKLIYVGPPDEEARGEMLKLHLRNRPTEDTLDIASLASSLSGYSASDIKFLVDEAPARLALRQDRSPITMDVLRNAIKRVPPSVTTEEESRFQSFAERGID